MSLNKAQGQMYDWVTHTYNTVKGQCFHDCIYCYMKRWGHLKPVRFDEKELKTDLGKDNFIFVGSSCDMWAENIPNEWIEKTLEYLSKFDNKYLFQTKTPKNLRRLIYLNYEYCVTLESNRFYHDIMMKSPPPVERVHQIKLIRNKLPYITIEPILDFDLDIFVEMLESCMPKQINIGANTSNIKLPEPSKEKVLQLISELEKIGKVHLKSNLKRIIGDF